MKYFDNHFLFSETYIKEYIKQENKKKTEDNDVDSAFKQVKEWNSEYVSGDYANDQWFGYIDSVLDVLKFPDRKCIENTRLLYADAINDSEKPVAVCYYVDKDEDIGTSKKGKYYAYNALKAANEQGVNWAMLTNGYRWRIYNTKNVSPYENYLEIDIEESIKNNSSSDDAFKLFYLFFNVRTYFTKDGELEIEKIKDLSDARAETIEEALRGKAEEILKELCYGLKENMNKESYSEEEKKAIYNDAIILLYRLLFFGYAESRGLLPIVENDPEYDDSYKKLCDDAKDIHNSGEVYRIKDGFEFWERLDNHIRYYVDKSYNGGLFHNDDKSILREHRITNGRLTKCLAELSFNADKTGKYTLPIEYKDLSVRNLGSIYEGLLEYQLFIAEERMVQRKSKGKVNYLRATEVKLQNSDLRNIIEKGGIYLSQDALERKETGAYYTPEDVVQYIVENTVGKKLKELYEVLKDKKRELFLQLSYEPLESRKRVLQNEIDEITIDFIKEKILSLSIIDSAMGSGHFLVNAAYRVANEILEIVCENDWENDDIIADIKYWKRKVVENCIYGIDINYLSVALARLSLWLISASNDRALSFIDHHLKEGNSIIGTDRKHVEVKDSKYPIFGVSYDEYMKPILIKYRELERIESGTRADVLRQKEIYDEIKEELKIAKKKYDYYLASQYAGGIDDQITYINLLRSNNILDFQDVDMEPLWKIARVKKFFHWELEFPEVFQKGGFDIAIGNPPYVDAQQSEYKHTSLKFTGTTNLYAYMIENNIYNLKKDSFDMSLIVLISFVCSDRMKPLRDYIVNNDTFNMSVVNIDSSKNPGTLFKNVIARLVILTVSNDKSRKDKLMKTTDYIKFFRKDRKNLFNKIETISFDREIIIDGIVPKIGTDIEISILRKMFSKTKSNIIQSLSSVQNDNCLYYRDLGITYYGYAFCEPPLFRVNGENRIPTTLSKLNLEKDISKQSVACIFYSSLFYWFWNVYSDCYHLTKSDIARIPIDLKCISSKYKDRFETIYNEIEESLNKNGKLVTYNKKAGVTEYFEFKPRLSKTYFDKVDILLAEYYNFSDEELNFIINYDLRFRIDEDSNGEDK